MASGQRKVYDAKVRRRAIALLADGAGHRLVASKVGIPDGTARQWARAYAAGGAPAVMSTGSVHRMYPFELKLAVVKDRLEHGLSMREAMIKHGVTCESSIKLWCRVYRQQGEAGLMAKTRSSASN